MEVRTPGLVVDGKVNWDVFEQVLINNPCKTMFEIPEVIMWLPWLAQRVL